MANWLADALFEFFKPLLEWFMKPDKGLVAEFMKEELPRTWEAQKKLAKESAPDDSKELKALLEAGIQEERGAIETGVKDYIHGLADDVFRTLSSIPTGEVSDIEGQRKKFTESILDVQLDLWWYSTLIETASLGQLEAPLKLMEIIQQGLGTQWLGYLTWSPMIRWGLGNPLSKFYAKKYRNEPTATGQAVEFYSKGLIDSGTLDARLAEQGISKADSTNLQATAYSEIPARTLRTLHKTFPEIDLRLDDRFKQLRYNPSDFDLLKKYIESTEDVQTKELSITVAGKAFNKGLRTDSWFREFLKTQGFNDDSISLYVDLYKSEELDTERTIMKSDVVSALKSGKIDESKARQWLDDLHYTPDAINLLVSMATTTKDAELRDASISVYENLYINNRLDENAYRAKLKDLGVSESGIDAYIDRDNLKKIEKPNLLSESSILAAFKGGLKDRQWTGDYLKQLNYSDDDILVLLKLHEPKAA